jgi:hypothetical protein
MRTEAWNMHALNEGIERLIRHFSVELAVATIAVQSGFEAVMAGLSILNMGRG